MQVWSQPSQGGGVARQMGLEKRKKKTPKQTRAIESKPKYSCSNRKQSKTKERGPMDVCVCRQADGENLE